MKNLLIANNHDSFVYNLVELLRELSLCTFEIHDTELITPAMVARCQGMILSPGPGLPYEQEGLISLIDTYHTRLPILGVCLGHQALAHYFGARLQQIQVPLHGHSDRIVIDNCDELLDGIPMHSRIGRYHSWVVSPNNLPDTLQITAHAQSDGAIMAFRHRTHPLWGVQFHPESYISEHGSRYLHNFMAQVSDPCCG